MADRTAPLLTDDAVAAICLTVLIVTFMLGGVVLLCFGHDSGLVLCGASLVGAYLFLGG